MLYKNKKIIITNKNQNFFLIIDIFNFVLIFTTQY